MGAGETARNSAFVVSAQELVAPGHGPLQDRLRLWGRQQRIGKALLICHRQANDLSLFYSAFEQAVQFRADAGFEPDGLGAGSHGGVSFG